MDEMKEAGARCSLKLSDAMEEALTLDADGFRLSASDDGGEGDGKPITESRLASRTRSGFRFQRCGGGRRVIRRSSGRNY